MTDSIADFFQGLSQRGYERGLANVTGTVRFVINQRGHADEWCVRIDKGDLRVSAGSAGVDCGDPDCVISAARDVIGGIATGEVNPLAAMLRGDLLLSGDPELIAACRRLFGPPPRVPADAEREGVS
jgi:hypothetical protein